MRKYLLCMAILPLINFSNSKILTITPNVEIGHLYGIPKTFQADLGVGLEFRKEVTRVKKNINLELGGGLSQDFFVDKSQSALSGAYALAELDFAMKKNITVYTQAKLGLGAYYELKKSTTAYLGILAAVEAGVEYKDIRLGISIGTKGKTVSGDPGLATTLKLGYDIPIKK